ncbi:MAG: radical SAM protein [Thermodesulfobacteriota bacterium]|nr:radical SAM protein [Thermodesulfobacteriota bacterium]
MNEKDPLAERLVCKGNCFYYKPGSDKGLACRGFTVAEALLQHDPDMSARFPLRKGNTFEDQYPELLHHLLCRHCEFFIEGCDFTDPDYTDPALPCGGYVVAAALLQQSGTPCQRLLEALIPKGAKILLSPHCTLKQLESPYLYDMEKDELYELDQGGFDFLKKCDGRHLLSGLPVDKDFLEFCLKEGLLVTGTSTDERPFILRPSPVPSLRYLELQLTRRCNLKCKHCYLGTPRELDLSLSEVVATLKEFEKMQGLRVLFSGGEPLLYPELRNLNKRLPQFALRKVLLTNGTRITEENQDLWSHFDEIQVSLDGLKEGHEALRGPGTFARAVRGMEIATKKGVPISIATMVHRHNLKEFDGLARWIERQQVVEWNIDVPCEAGRLSENSDFLVAPEEGAPFLEYATGGSYHGSGEPFTCGYHLCTVTPEGDVLKCGFFQDRLGSLKEGLEVSWKRSRHIALSELECAPCPHLSDCKGGCRFRATSPLGKDPVMCAFYGAKNQDKGQ